MLKVQDLSPKIYYEQSRDFQYLGRLFDLILNYSKNGTDMIYHNPLSDNSDDRLLDLMTLTLGFKSKHNYNIRQLKALCSGFAEIIRNKGNKLSLIKAVAALLNAEGITEEAEFAYEYDAEKDTFDHTKLLLFIPETLSDLNLLRDLLDYILPAGISINIIREFRLQKESLTELTTEDSLTIYEQGPSPFVPVDVNAKSIVPQVGQAGLTDALARSTPGLLMNTGIIQPTTVINNYNIIYIMNDGVFTTHNNKWFYYQYSDSTDQEISLPTEADVEKPGYKFKGWYDTSDFSEKIEEITLPAGSTGDKTFYAKWEPIIYTISYDLDGGSVATANPTTYTVESGTFTLNNPTKTGYTFTGWSGTGIDGTSMSVTIVKGSTGNKTLVAKWE